MDLDLDYFRTKIEQLRADAFKPKFQRDFENEEESWDSLLRLINYYQEVAQERDALQERVSELTKGVEEIGCRTDHGDQLEPCPICQIVDRLLGVQPSPGADTQTITQDSVRGCPER